MDVDPGFKYIEKFRGGFHWYMLESKDFIGTLSFKLEKEKRNLVSLTEKVLSLDYHIKKFDPSEQVLVRKMRKTLEQPRYKPIYKTKTQTQL